MARFILSSKFEHSDSNLFRFLEVSNLVHSKLKFELMGSNLLPCPMSSSAPRPLGAAYVPILLSEVEHEQRPSGNGDREAIVVEAGLSDGDDERAYTACPTL